ncbi:MAG TPA: ribonuclease Y, partial [bacterium]|nr:ribonuclease Y [bacterium]
MLQMIMGISEMGWAMVACASLACLVIGYLFRKYTTESKTESAEKLAARIVEEAEKEAQTKRREAVLEAKDHLFAEKTKFEQETREIRQELHGLEKKLSKREDNLDKRSEAIEKKEREIQSQSQKLKNDEDKFQEKQKELDQLVAKQITQLEKLANLSTEEAKQLLLSTLEQELVREQAVLIRRVTEETKEQAKKKAREIITTAIERCASDQVVESTVSSVSLPSDEMKGRIIGREGRNIRSFEAITGINLVIDDTPEAVVLSGYDPVRREIARRTLEKLIQDGRIHPGRIEELFNKTTKEVDEIIMEEGQQAAFDVGVHELHSEMIRFLGRLKFRSSYGQNVLQHSIEVARLAAIMASELGADFELSKRAGLLHDIGKSVDFEMEGTHAKIGADLAKRYNESYKIVHAIAAHHEDEEAHTIEAVLVAAADAISAARPGVRRETLETYVKRLEKLEEVAISVPVYVAPR